jgi:diaminopimelate epimerase
MDAPRDGCSARGNEAECRIEATIAFMVVPPDRLNIVQALVSNCDASHKKALCAESGGVINVMSYGNVKAPSAGAIAAIRNADGSSAQMCG